MFSYVDKAQNLEMQNPRKYLLKIFYFWNKFCLFYPQYFIFWEKIFNKYFPTINLTKPNSFSKLVAWSFSALVKYLAWCVRVHIYNLPFQAIAFYFEYKTQNVYSVLYIPEIIAFLYFVSFPFGFSLVRGAINDYRGTCSNFGNNVEEVFKSVSSLFKIKDTQNKMWIVPFLWIQNNVPRRKCDLILEFSVGYFRTIVLIFLISIGSWIPPLCILPFLFNNNYEEGEY